MSETLASDLTAIDLTEEDLCSLNSIIILVFLISSQLMIVNFSYFPACMSGQEIKAFSIQVNKLGSTHYCFFFQKF